MIHWSVFLLFWGFFCAGRRGLFVDWTVFFVCLFICFVDKGFRAWLGAVFVIFIVVRFLVLASADGRVWNCLGRDRRVEGSLVMMLTLLVSWLGGWW